MADLKTTNIFGDAYINNKVGIATNAPATRLQIGQLSPTATTEGIQFGDDPGTRIYRSSAGTLTLSGSVAGLTLSASTALYGNYGDWSGESNKIQWHSNNLYFVNRGGGSWLFRNSSAANVFSIAADGGTSAATNINAGTYVYAGTYLQTNGNLIYPSGYGATQTLQVGNAANNAWIAGISIAPGGNVTVFNDLTVNGNTYLGNANNDTVYVNDTIRIGATDSGDASLFFGEGAVAGSDYGARWYWDSGYTFYWYTRNNGTDTQLFNYVTNDLSYVNWNRNFNMQNYAINYNGQIHFNAGTRFVGNNTSYLNFRSDSAGAGGILVQDGNATTKGYTGYWDSAGGGILNNTGNWAVRYNFGNANSGGQLYGDWSAANFTATTFTGTLNGNANAVSFTEVELNAPVTVSGTWTTGNGSEWGEPKFGTSFNQFRYTDGNGPYVEYNIPANHHACFISQLQWDTGGYADCHGVQSDGDLVFLRRINTRQLVENSNHGNPIQHDGATVTFVGSGLQAFSKIRITNRSGRIHMTGIAFTRQVDDGYEGTGMLHPAQISHQGAGSGLDADLLDGYSSATANTANTIVLRDGSGNFSAGTITATLSGNATTATSINGFGNPTTNSTANTIVYREGNGYITNNYFYTSGGGSERNASGMAYFAGFNSSDYYIRSYTAAAVATLISGQTMNINGSSTSAGCVNSDTGNVGDSRLQYWQTSGNTALNPDGEWYNAIRMGHGNPVTYYSNTLAVRMTGGNLGDIYTRTTTNGATGSWNRFWHNNNDGAGSGLDADLLDGYGSATANTANTIVLRDGSGNFSAGTITATLNGNASFATSAGSVISGAYVNANNTFTGTNVQNSPNNTFINTVSNANQSLTFYQGTAGADAYMTFHVGGDFAGYFGLGGAENDLVYGGWSVGNNRYRILHSGNASFAWNMNQNVRTTDTCSFAAVTATTFTGALNGSATSLVSVNTYTVGALNVNGMTQLAGVKETYVAVSPSSNVVTIDLNAGTVFRMTYNSVISSFTISNLTSAKVNSFTLISIASAGAGGITFTFSGYTLKWAGGTAPTATTTAGKFDVFSFIYDGTNWYGFTGGLNY
jgi:hypothetical protein